MSDEKDPVVLAEAMRQMAEEMYGQDPLNMLLHDEQAALTWGSTFAVFGTLNLPEPEHRFIVYGRVPTQIEMIRVMRNNNLTPEFRAESIKRMDDKIGRHLLPSIVYSHHRPAGVTEEIPAAVAWPIAPEVLEKTRDHKFRWDEFCPGEKAMLGIACAAYRTHQLVTGGTP